MVVTIAMNKLRCVEKVSYVTAPGERITAVVTDLGVFEKLPGEDTLTLTGYYANSGFKDAGEAVESIADKCGWELAVAEDLEVIEAPTLDELRDIRLFDPRRYFLDG
jgi:acyl CoA:acetate/3-ketoacid CoA transferase beta subunit